MTIHEVGTAFCLSDHDRDEILSMYRSREIPMKKQALVQRRKHRPSRTPAASNV